MTKFLMNKKDQRTAMAKLLPPEKWEDMYEITWGEKPKDPNDKINNLSRKMHEREYIRTIEKLQSLFGKDFTPSKLKIVNAFPLLYMGWEGDYYAWSVKYDGDPCVIGTSHGSYYFMSAEDLVLKLNQYTEAVWAAEDALAFLKGND